MVIAKGVIAVKLICGDARDEIQKLEQNSIQTVITSPPYWNLRDYGNEKQIGFNQGLNEYINDLADILDSTRKVLNPNGSLWVNLGDKYENQDLQGIPWRLAFAMKDKGWILRQDVIWAKSNPMPESTKTRCTKSHEYFFHFVLNRSYYYDADAIREKSLWFEKDRRALTGREVYASKFKDIGKNKQQAFVSIPEYRNRRDVWTVATKPYKGAHFAVMPEALIEPALLSCSKAGDVILDPFMGSGTVGLTAQKNNRHFIGIDLNIDYVKLARERILQNVDNTSL